jgi:acyl transferase domain-containing protein
LLDAISVDIARTIRHEAASELWERHKRGERNVFTRKLYTPQGQQTFDEIRRRYQREPDFRRTVDRYVDEFERLLDEVSRDDRDSSLAKTYLTSETGKVYTMLAHASGRLNG